MKLNPSSLPYSVNIMIVGILATKGAIASTAMILTNFVPGIFLPQHQEG